MNKIYRVVFNRSLAVWQVVSELAGGNSKSSSAANESVVDSVTAGLSGVKKSFAKTFLQLAVVSAFGVLATASVQAQVIVDPIKNDVSANILATDGQTGNVTWNEALTIGGTTDGVVTLDGVDVDWVFAGTSSTFNLGSMVANGSKGTLTLNNSSLTSNSGSWGSAALATQVNLRNGSSLILDNSILQFGNNTGIVIRGIRNTNSEIIVTNHSVLGGLGLMIATLPKLTISDHSSVFLGAFTSGSPVTSVIENFRLTDNSTLSNADCASLNSDQCSLSIGNGLIQDSNMVSPIVVRHYDFDRSASYDGGNLTIKNSTLVGTTTLSNGASLLVQNSAVDGGVFFSGNNTVLVENSNMSGVISGSCSFSLCTDNSFTLKNSTWTDGGGVYSNLRDGVFNIVDYSVVNLAGSVELSDDSVLNIRDSSVTVGGDLGGFSIYTGNVFNSTVDVGGSFNSELLIIHDSTLDVVGQMDVDKIIAQNSQLTGSSAYIRGNSSSLQESQFILSGDLALSSIFSAQNSQLIVNSFDVNEYEDYDGVNSTFLNSNVSFENSTLSINGNAVIRGRYASVTMAVIDSDMTVFGDMFIMGEKNNTDTYISSLVLQQSNVTIGGNLNIGFYFDNMGKLILQNDAVLSVVGNIQVGGIEDHGCRYSLNCGGHLFIGGEGTAVAPGAIHATNINLGGNVFYNTGYALRNNTINFNHTDTTGNYIFASNIHGGHSNSSINVLAGTTVFTGTSNNYIAPTNISGGILRAGAANTLSSASDHTIQAGGELDLGGYTQTLLSLNNQGILNFGGSHNNGYHPLTITGDITGGGNFIMHTNLVGGVGNTVNVLGTVYGNHSIIVVDSSASLPTGGERFTVVTQGNTTGAGNFTMAGTQMAASFGAFQYDLTIIPSADGLSWQIAALPGVTPTTPPIALPPPPLPSVLVTGSVINAISNNNLTDTWSGVVIGNSGLGSIDTSKGVVISANGQLQIGNGGSGTLTMTEASVLNGSGVDITVGSGVNQQGEIRLTQGSSINLGASDSLVLGAAVGSRGEITLTNNGSKLRLQDNTLVLGQQGTGVLTINAGTSVDLNNVQVVLGQELTGQGILTLDNTQLKADSFTLGGHGKGTLTLTGNGSLQIDNGGAAGTGTLYFADAFTAGDPDTANGTLSINSANAQVLASTWSLSNSVTPDKGTATINFNHGNVTSGYTVTADIINGNNNSQINLRSGLTTFMGNNTYAGSTQVYNNSELKAGSATALSPNAKYQVDSGGRLDLNGFAHTLAGLNNTGLVDFGGAINNGYNPLTITGDLTGGGNFIMHTNLVTGVGNTIDVQGTVAGNHNITVVDSSASLPTGGERFTIVTQGNTTGGGNFTMAGTQIAGASTRAVSFGAFQYDVTIAQAADGLSWQIAALPGVAPTTPPPVTPLVPPGGGGNNGGSPLIPQVYDPARLSKAANMIMGTQASVMTALNGQMDIMHSRTRELSSSPMALAAQFATTPYNMYASNGDNLPSSAPNNWSANQPTISLWTQGFRNKNTIDNGSSRSFDQRNDGLSLGGDYALVLEEGVVFIGAMVGKSKSEQTFDDPSSSELKNDFVGLYSTYAGADGLRISGGIQLSYLKSDLTVVDNIGQQFSGDYRQLGVSASAELGYRFDLANAYFIEPRIGIQMTRVGKEEYTLSNGLKSSDSGFDIVQGRLGVMTGKQFHLDSGGIVRTFVEGSAVNTLSGDADITINNAELLKNNMVGNYMELGAGVSYLFADKHQLSLGFQYRDGNKFTSPWGANISYLVRF